MIKLLPLVILLLASQIGAQGIDTKALLDKKEEASAKAYIPKYKALYETLTSPSYVVGYSNQKSSGKEKEPKDLGTSITKPYDCANGFDAITPVLSVLRCKSDALDTQIQSLDEQARSDGYTTYKEVCFAETDPVANLMRHGKPYCYSIPTDRAIYPWPKGIKRVYDTLEGLRYLAAKAGCLVDKNCGIYSVKALIASIKQEKFPALDVLIKGGAKEARPLALLYLLATKSTAEKLLKDEGTKQEDKTPPKPIPNLPKLSLLDPSERAAAKGYLATQRYKKMYERALEYKDFSCLPKNKDEYKSYRAAALLLLPCEASDIKRADDIKGLMREYIDGEKSLEGIVSEAATRWFEDNSGAFTTYYHVINKADAKPAIYVSLLALEEFISTYAPREIFMSEQEQNEAKEQAQQEQKQEQKMRAEKRTDALLAPLRPMISNYLSLGGSITQNLLNTFAKVVKEDPESNKTKCDVKKAVMLTTTYLLIVDLKLHKKDLSSKEKKRIKGALKYAKIYLETNSQWESIYTLCFKGGDVQFRHKLENILGYQKGNHLRDHLKTFVKISKPTPGINFLANIYKTKVWWLVKMPHADDKGLSNTEISKLYEEEEKSDLARSDLLPFVLLDELTNKEGLGFLKPKK